MMTAESAAARMLLTQVTHSRSDACAKQSLSACMLVSVKVGLLFAGGTHHTQSMQNFVACELIWRASTTAASQTWARGLQMHSQTQMRQCQVWEQTTHLCLRHAQSSASSKLH